ncbi:MAG: hypothetical protein O3A20_01305 [Planctomycetota bacterium]|nr:hypothetical protein [Planctomycetota bacterium]
MLSLLFPLLLAAPLQAADPASKAPAPSPAHTAYQWKSEAGLR